MSVSRVALIVAAIVCLVAVPLHAQPIDHRISQSPVKDQGARGTCVSFAINAAIETFPGVPTDLSEQMSYAAVKLHQNEVDQWLRGMNRPTILSEGDTFKTYVSLAAILGTCHESLFPYDPNPRKLPDDAPVEIKRFIELAHVDPGSFDALRMAMGKYRIAPDALTRLEGDEVRDIERVKRELSDGRLAIPVIYQINGPAWSDLPKHANTDRAGRRDIIHPGMMHEFKPPDADPMPYNLARLEAARRGVKLVDVVLKGEWLVRKPFDEAGYGGHAVTIVGFDDYGFIIKNSWGTGWANDGYARVSFDYHQLYATEAVLIDRVTIQPPNPSPLVKTRSIREARWHLKVHPGIARLDDAGRPSIAWMLSVWALEPREPDCEIVEYSVAMQSAPGQPMQELLRRVVAAGAVENRNGMPLTLPDDVHARLADAALVYVTVRFGDLPLGPDDLAAARYLAEHRFVFPASQITGARDFAPVR